MKFGFAIAASFALLATHSAWAHEAGASAAESYGRVSFPTSCTPAAQQQFDRAVAMLHSFFYPATVKAFHAVTETDPQCAIAYWGIAVSSRPNPLVAPFTAEVLKGGLEATRKGKAIGAKTERERDWLDAIELVYKDFDKVDQMTRSLAYEQAMERLMRKYPDDKEAAIFYALALNETADLKDKTYSKQLKAAAILEAVAKELPDHPGVLHYIIHSYDFAPIAARGLPAAHRYAQVAPSAPHAQHMPSHIFSMVGEWDAAIRSDQGALAAARDFAAKNHPGITNSAEPHSLDFMSYAYLQLGRDREAKNIVDEVQRMEKFNVTRRITTDTGLMAPPVRYVLERAAWKEAIALEPRQSQFAYALAMTHFARAMGAARLGNVPMAKREIEKIDELRRSAEKARLAYWAEQIEVLILAASAWSAEAEGRLDAALKLMRAAADLEGASDKHVAMENRLYPMRELLGEMLLVQNQPAQALQEFEASLKVSPNRLRGFYGAAKAAAAANDRAKARAYYEKLAALGRAGHSDRPELREAGLFLTRN